MTEKLFEVDSYCKKFDAKVLSCVECDGGFYVTLDRTAFFPEGGGQASDRGFLGGAAVSDVQISDGDILHKTDKPLNVGSTVCGEIDWELRFSRMQSHTAEHIVSGIVHREFGYSNVGFHMSERTMTVDFSGKLCDCDIARVERLANEAVYKNAAVNVFFPTKEEASALDYRSKLDIAEGLRIVEIEGIDVCACCAPHLKRSGEAGAIKIIAFCPFKSGTRIEMTAGIFAYEDHALLHSSNKRIMGLLSASREAVDDAVSKLCDTVAALKSENASLSKRLALYELDKTELGGAMIGYAKSASYDDLRYCANSISEGFAAPIILLSECDEGAIYVVACRESGARAISAALNSAFSGKGGGKDNYAQGKISVFNKSDIEALIKGLI